VRIVGIFCLLCFFVFSPCLLANSSTLDVYPSAEELFEAYLRGDIDYQTYVNLIEIFEDGIDSTDLYLLEEIPNIDYFLKSDSGDYLSLESEQIESYFVPSPLRANRPGGSLKALRYQKLEENGQNMNQLSAKSSLGRDWMLDFRLSDDYAGKREWARRSLTYNGLKGPLRKMVLGNYTARFGLGLNVGYRGRLLGGNTESFGKTLLYPNYGGFNGIYVEGGRKQDAIRMLTHFDRIGDSSFIAGAFDFARSYKGFRIEGILLGAAIKSRSMNVQYRHYQLGAFLQYSGRSFNTALEAALPKGASEAVPSMLFETQFKKDDLGFKFSAWHYAEDFLNLIGGGRAGSLSQIVTIDTIDFHFHDRRVDQRGMLLKSQSRFRGNVRHEFTLSIYGKDRYNNFIKLVSTLEIPIGAKSSVRIDYRNGREKNPEEVLTENEVRTEFRFKERTFSLRSYVGYIRDKKDKEYISCFVRARRSFRDFGSVEMWLNFDRINTETGQIDYFYGYIKEAVKPTSFLEIGAKYSYRYSRWYSDREQSILQLEAKVEW